MSRKWRFWSIPVGLVVLCLLAYGPVWRNDFIDLDDEGDIRTNSHITDGLSSPGLGWAFTTFKNGNWIPLVWITLQADATLTALTGVNLAVFCHAQNLFWHATTVVLLFLTLTRLTQRVGPSAVVAALFAVHPLHVESVAWATERKDVLSTFFWVLTVYAYARYAELPSRNRYIPVLGAFVLGLMAKSMLVTLPCALLLLDYWPLRRWGATGFWPLLREKLPLFAVAGVIATLTITAQRSADAMDGLEVIPLSARLANAVVSYVWYLEKTFWPTGLALFYPHLHSHWTWPPVLASGGVLVAVSGVAIALARRAPWLLVGWLWFLGTLVPVIGLIQVGAQARADRYVYVPHIGLFVAVVWSLDALLDRWKIRAVGTALAGACVAACAALTWVQIGYWEDAETIWEHTLDVTQNNLHAHNAMGRLLVYRGQTTGDRETFRRGLEHYRTAVEIDPSLANLWYNLGLAHLIIGELDKAVDSFQAALQRDPTHDDARINLGLAQHHLHDDAAAELTLRPVMQNPEPATRGLYGLVLWNLGRRAEARREWEKTLRAEPKQPDAVFGMGCVWLDGGDIPRAQRNFAVAEDMKPLLIDAPSYQGISAGRLNDWTNAIAQHKHAVERQKNQPNARRDDLSVYTRRLAFALHNHGETEAARQEYTRATQLQPDWRKRDRQTAWQLATTAAPTPGDAATGWELASQVCQAVSDPSADDLDTLAAALAALQRFDEAVTVAQQAASKSAPPRAAAIAERIARYQKKQPFVRSASETQ
jgi:protein O-mannosyl-transferase